jgi:hypothetical protein
MAAKRPAQNLPDTLDDAELDEAPTAPKKPRRGRPPGSSKNKKSSGKRSGIMECAGPHSLFLVAVVEDGDAEGAEAPVAEPPPPTSLNISYTFDIYSMVQMKKPGKKRGDPKRNVKALKSDEPWDTFKAQILTRIEKALKPATLSISDYKITFMVPRIQKMTDLDDEESYRFMVGQAVRSGDPSAVICIEPLIPEDVSYASAFFSFILMIMFRNPVLIRKTKTVAVAVRAGVM